MIRSQSAVLIGVLIAGGLASVAACAGRGGVDSSGAGSEQTAAETVSLHIDGMT